MRAKYSYQVRGKLIFPGDRSVPILNERSDQGKQILTLLYLDREWKIFYVLLSALYYCVLSASADVMITIKVKIKFQPQIVGRKN